MKLFAGDDGSDPAKHRQLVQQLVEQKRVIAFVANAEVFTGEGSVDYLNKMRIPVIGTDGGGDWTYTSPMYFPQSSAGNAAVEGFLTSVLSRTAAAGKRRVGLLRCVEAQLCRDIGRYFRAVAADQSVDPVYEGQSSLAQPDFTSECLAARNAGVQMLAVVFDTNTVSRVAASCARQGYHPTFATGAAIAQPVLEDDPNLDGALIAEFNAPWMLTNTSGRAEFARAVATYLKGTRIGPGHTQGWAAGKVFEFAAAGIPEPPTSAALLEGLWRISGNDLGGLSYPLEYRRDQPAERTMCWYDMGIEGGHYTSRDGGEFHCAEFHPA